MDPAVNTWLHTECGQQRFGLYSYGNILEDHGGKRQDLSGKVGQKHICQEAGQASEKFFKLGTKGEENDSQQQTEEVVDQAGKKKVQDNLEGRCLNHRIIAS